ncbi:hypothetical protein Tco_0317953 [Tanacetum coccineum]
METYDISERYIAPCFVNGLEAYDGEINLAFDENLISNEFTVKLCLDYEMRKGKKLVKKEPIVALKGELYFMKFIINPEEDDVEPGIILGRSFLRLAKGFVDFDNEAITVYPEPDPFEDDSKKIGKYWTVLVNWEAFNSRRIREGSVGNKDQLKNDKVELDGKIVKEDEEAVKRIKGEALKERDEPGAFIFPIILEGKVNKNALTDTGSHYIDCQVLILDIPIDRDLPIVVGRGFLRTIGGMINTSERIFSTFDGFCHQTFRAARSDFMRNAESDSDDEDEYIIKRNKFRAPIYGPRPASYLNYTNPEDHSSSIQKVTNPFRKISVWKKAISLLGSLPVPLKQVNWKPEYKGLYTKEKEATGQWRLIFMETFICKDSQQRIRT